MVVSGRIKLEKIAIFFFKFLDRRKNTATFLLQFSRANSQKNDFKVQRLNLTTEFLRYLEFT